ncbi:diguanylate cyclase (GGDEF) domain-containing protein [Cohaesibacter sp. ES.047]|uniref:putative bifunctional diguanylate cyclase/phosphodiesterase n=1 Tax=Cohaesibacter sp. ES.047 TaxID=1798205 RepID=UPI000BB74A30|nr:EAL domain-containing protein [Cohaesibacter sp. ES.047]SNY92213.1 diguanylate cyclase (GGDEF) domain-containing protein [Cohaesibacter sp. ES.047]
MTLSIRQFVASVKNWYLLDRDNLNLKKAQLEALSTQLPIMYAIILICGGLLSYEYVGIAPDWLTFYPMLASMIVVLPRIVHWLNFDAKTVNTRTATMKLTSVIHSAGAIAFAFSVWVTLLYQFGDDLLKAHTAFFMAFSVVTCIFCLSVLPPAAVVVSVIVASSLFVYAWTQWDMLAFGALTNLTLVCIGMLIVSRRGFQSFKQMVSEQARSQQLADVNFELANRDNLTGLANRRSFYAHLEHECLTSCAEAYSLAVGSIDLDEFKLVNDLYSHLLGDELLKEVGHRLDEFHKVYSDVTFFRIGGDEFVFTFRNPASTEDCQTVGDEICHILAQPYALKGIELSISATVGLAVFDASNDGLADLMEKADFALYKGKSEHVGQCVLFSEELNEQFRRSGQIKSDLKRAHFSDEICPLFQPIVDSVDNRVIAFEALARWHNPRLGLVAPDEFISVAENLGVIGDITRVILEKSLSALSDWPAPVSLSVNLSALDVSDEKLMLWFYRQIGKRGIAPQRLNIEITETALNSDIEQVVRNLGLFRNLGCAISLDDFGVGHSSLTRLHHFPLSKIKIDRSFVSGLHKGMKNYKIVKSLSMLARDMDLDCIVEGVETKAELEALHELGLRHIQGFYFAKPMSRSDALDYLNDVSSKPNQRSA